MLSTIFFQFKCDNVSSWVIYFNGMNILTIQNVIDLEIVDCVKI